MYERCTHELQSPDGSGGLLLALRNARQANLQLLLLLHAGVKLRLLLLQGRLETCVARDLVIQGGLDGRHLLRQLIDLSQPSLKLGSDKQLSVEGLLLIG